MNVRSKSRVRTEHLPHSPHLQSLPCVLPTPFLIMFEKVNFNHRNHCGQCTPNWRSCHNPYSITRWYLFVPCSYFYSKKCQRLFSWLHGIFVNCICLCCILFLHFFVSCLFLVPKCKRSTFTKHISVHHKTFRRFSLSAWCYYVPCHLLYCVGRCTVKFVKRKVITIDTY